jgi:MFS family permease
MFYGPVFVLFYEKVGLNFADITKLKVIIFITITLLEVPLGSYSDIYGIKKTIKMGIMFFILSFSITAFSNHFFVFAISSIIFGIASALISGCTQILLFDFLKQQGKSDSFTKENGSRTLGYK